MQVEIATKSQKTADSFKIGFQGVQSAAFMLYLAHTKSKND